MNRENWESQLKEYETMVVLIENISERMNQLFMFAFTAVGAILTFAIQQKNAYMSLPGSVFLILIRCRYLYYRNTYFKMNGYISVFCERQLKIGYRNLAESSEVKPKSMVHNLQYFSFAILGIGCFLVFMLFYENGIVSLHFAIFLTMGIIFMDAYYLLSGDQIKRGYLEGWEKVRERIEYTEH